MTVETMVALSGAADHRRALDVVAERLAAEFPGRSDEIGTALAGAYARTADARVQAFRVLFAERDARDALRQGPEPGRPALRATA